MPYRDPRRKQEWEQRNRLRRLARRRELRRVQATEQQDTTPLAPNPVVGAGFPWLLFAGGGVMLALFKPALGSPKYERDRSLKPTCQGV